MKFPLGGSLAGSAILLPRLCRLISAAVCGQFSVIYFFSLKYWSLFVVSLLSRPSDDRGQRELTHPERLHIACR